MLTVRWHRVAALAAVALATLLVQIHGGTFAGDGREISQRRFSLGRNESEKIVFTPGETGTLVVTAEVRQPSAYTPVKLLLGGPGDLVVEKTGTAPLKLSYRLSSPEAAGESWHATVVNVAKVGEVTGRLTVEIVPAAAESGGETDGDAAANAAPPPVTDGRIQRRGGPRQLRAECRDQNRDVLVKVDLDAGEGGLYLGYNRVADLRATPAADSLIALRGDGDVPLYLDTARQQLDFRDGEQATFCKVKIYEEGN